MGKTFTHISSGRNDRAHKNEYEYDETFEESYKEIHKYEPATHYDVSFTTDERFEVPRRHPNKKKKRSLHREFTNTGVYGISSYRNAYADVNTRSFRLKGDRKEQTRRRRARMKENTQDMINNSINEENNV